MDRVSSEHLILGTALMFLFIPNKDKLLRHWRAEEETKKPILCKKYHLESRVESNSFTSSEREEGLKKKVVTNKESLLKNGG